MRRAESATETENRDVITEFVYSLFSPHDSRGLLARAAATGFVRFTSMSHGSIGILQINGVFDKTGFGMYNQQSVEKSDFEQSICVCVCVCVPVRLAVTLLANSHGRKGKPIELKL